MFVCGPAFFATVSGGAFIASLKFNDARNSQYVPVMTGIGSF